MSNDECRIKESFDLNFLFTAENAENAEIGLYWSDFLRRKNPTKQSASGKING